MEFRDRFISSKTLEGWNLAKKLLFSRMIEQESNFRIPKHNWS
jgi:hypothetical protein